MTQRCKVCIIRYFFDQKWRWIQITILLSKVKSHTSNLDNFHISNTKVHFLVTRDWFAMHYYWLWPRYYKMFLKSLFAHYQSVPLMVAWLYVIAVKDWNAILLQFFQLNFHGTIWKSIVSLDLWIIMIGGEKICRTITLTQRSLQPLSVDDVESHAYLHCKIMTINIFWYKTRKIYDVHMNILIISILQMAK